jgi:acyl-CoA thioesterase I
MKVYARLAVMLGFALAGCGQDPAPVPQTNASKEAATEVQVTGREVRMLALGDSLFAGYGVKAEESYPARMEAALRARGINARIVNAGVSGDTTAGGLARLKFTLDSQSAPPELVLVSLGGNDMLRGISPAETRANLDAILSELDRRGSKAVLMGMLAPPNLGADYRKAFDPIFPALARKHKAALVPFFLQSVTGRPDLVQPDRIHPTATGLETIVTATVETVAAEI